MMTVQDWKNRTWCQASQIVAMIRARRCPLCGDKLQARRCQRDGIDWSSVYTQAKADLKSVKE